MKHTFIDFFAGLGGFTAGLEQAGFKCIGFCEKDKYAIKSYRAIHSPKQEEWFSEDITTLNPSDIPYADGWTAGFPCQDVSVSGHQIGLDGQRSGLFFEIIRLIKGKAPEDKPRWVLLENVKNLLSINGGRDFTEVLYQLSEAGYDCEWQLINSKAYIPQNRERVFIIGHLRGNGPRKVFPIGHANTKTPVELISGAQGNRVYDPSGMSVTLTAQGGGGGARTGLYFIDLNKNPQITDNARCIKARYNAGVTNRGCDNSGVLVGARAVLTPDRENKRQNGRRFKGVGEPSFCLTCQDKNGVLVGGRIRKLTPLECFRLQGFSDEMFNKAQAVNSDNQLYKQIGNGVTIPVIYAIGKKLMEVYANGDRL